MTLKCFFKEDRCGISYRRLSHFVPADCRLSAAPPLPSLQLPLQPELPFHVRTREGLSLMQDQVNVSRTKKNRLTCSDSSVSSDLFRFTAGLPENQNMLHFLTHVVLSDTFIIISLRGPRGRRRRRGPYACLLSLESHNFRQLQFGSGLESTTWLHSEDLHFPSHSSVQSTNRMLRKLQQTKIHKSDKDGQLHLLALSWFCRQ